ncbi:hypothetical protein AB0D49_08505 [Streptomyces sp. NPDC048290]|uniref:hypothetical protein n=1 Tax=Streptomyces sp. NPDC048290 TaxID=3155811 RepID=UPI0034252A55
MRPEKPVVPAVRLGGEVAYLVARQREQRLAEGVAAESRHLMNPDEGPIEAAFAQMACDYPEACTCTPEESTR